MLMTNYRAILTYPIHSRKCVIYLPDHPVYLTVLLIVPFCFCIFTPCYTLLVRPLAHSITETEVHGSLALAIEDKKTFTMSLTQESLKLRGMYILTHHFNSR